MVTRPLTDREQVVVRILASGATNKEIAARLGLREQTVKNRLSNIYEKLGLRNRLELAIYLTRMVELAGPAELTRGKGGTASARPLPVVIDGTKVLFGR
jgi:DNA-binding CsgD family transcriptional regulator